jgi:hypothetical protein
LHQINIDQTTLDLKPIKQDRAGTGLEEMLELARRRSDEPLGARLLPNLAPYEPAWKRLMWFVIAIAVVWAHYYLVRSFWAPAHPGVDQNGYQVGGKLFSQSFSTGFKPPNPFSYVGWMWVLSPNGWVYPKYPLGLPVLDALCLWIAPTIRQGVSWAYLVSPVCSVLASAAIYLMLRMFTSSFAAVVGTILMATNPVSLVLANNSNSHAPALAFGCWGILFLLWWMRYGTWWRGFIAGLLLGYAVTIRYTEGLLILPIAAAVLTSIRYPRGSEIRWWAICTWIILIVTGLTLRSIPSIHTEGWRTWLAACGFAILIALLSILRTENRSARNILGELLRCCICAAIFFFLMRFDLPMKGWKSLVDRSIVVCGIILALTALTPILYTIPWSAPRTYLRPACVLIGWLIPVIALVAFNKGAMNSWTGYDTTNESDGFSWNYFIDKWDFMIGQVYNTGLFFVAPLGIAGMILLYRKSARLGAVMTLWFVPGLLLYTGYYWGMDSRGVGYLRFFLTLFPPIVFCAIWLLDDVSRRGIRRGSFAAPIAAGLIVAIASAMNVYGARPAMDRDFTIQQNLADAGDHVFLHVKNTFEGDLAHRPLLFGEQRGFLNYMQFAGNFECYSFEAFSQRGGNRMWRNSDPDAPNPLQKARVDAMRKLYEGKSDNQLWAEGNKIVSQALADKRHVYAALPTAMMLGFKMRFSPKEFDVVTLDKWRDPVTMSDEGKKALLGMGPAALMMGGRATPQTWELIEITKRTSPIAPALPAVKMPAKLLSKPTSRPATAPTTRPKALFEIK